MRAVFVDQDAVIVVMVVGIAADMGAAIHNQNFLAGLRGQSLGNDTAGKPGPHNEIVEHDVISSFLFN